MVLILLNAFFVAGEFAIVSVDRSLIERKANEGDKSASLILRSLRNLSFELSGAQLGITVTSLILGFIAEPTLARLISPLFEEISWFTDETTLALSIGIAFILATGTQMVFGELVPKNLAISRPFASAVWFGIPMQIVNRILQPLILFLNRSANWTVRRLGIEPREELAGVRSVEELELMIRSSGEAGWLDDSELRLLTRALSFTEKIASDAMIPRVNIAGLSRHESVADLRRESMATGHSRFPVYDEDLDSVIGIAHIKDTIEIPPARMPITEVGSISQPALEVPETSSLEYVLNELRTSGKGMAVVVDEYGGTAGIVTIEDLLEEIFGEIEDEYDRDAATTTDPDNVEILSGLLHRHEVEELIGFEWPEGRYETLGGLIVAHRGTFPSPGDVIRLGGFAFEVLSMDGLRVDEVKATKTARREATQ
ncbi:MAG: hemolysin family protein [Acidimicrobiia bacterium]